MRRIIQYAAALLLITAVIVALFAVREYRRERDYSDEISTRFVKLQDSVSAAGEAMDALQEAEIREENYVLTGETIYFEGYANSIGQWRDQVSVLAIQAANDPIQQLVSDLTSAGDRTVKELALVISLYDAGSRAEALDRIRKGSGVVYLDQARDVAGKAIEVENEELSTTNKLIHSNSLRSRRSLARSVELLFSLTLISVFLLMFQARRGRDADRAR